MKPSVKVEPMFAGDERYHIRPLVALGVLAIVLTSGALALQAQSVDEQDGRQPPGATRPPVAARPRDRFEGVARADLDPKMVVKAPRELDAAMVIAPQTDRRHGEAPGGLRSSPGLSRTIRVPHVPSIVPNPGSR